MIWSISDLHLTSKSDPKPIDAWVAECIKAAPETLVLNGDIGDPWQEDWSDIVEGGAWKLMKLLVGYRADEGLKTIWVNRNHDYNARPEYLKGSCLTSRCQIGKNLFAHGYEFDLSWGGFGIPGIAPVAFWISEHAPGLMLPIYHALYKTPSQQKNHTGQLNDAWNVHVGLIHLRAMEYAQKRGLRVFIGHTHSPAPFNGLMADSGDFVDSFSWLQIDGDKVELKFL